jgi:hypothetical protein
VIATERLRFFARTRTHLATNRSHAEGTHPQPRAMPSLLPALAGTAIHLHGIAPYFAFTIYSQFNTAKKMKAVSHKVSLLLMVCFFWLPTKSNAQLFTSVPAIENAFAGLGAGAAAWGDYDKDGDLDLLISGWPGPPMDQISRVYRNDAGTFTDIQAGLTGVTAWQYSLAWGDYDGDDDLDILLAGYSPDGSSSKVYRNDAGTFTDIHAALDSLELVSIAWADYDSDGDLDILQAGDDGIGNEVIQLYRNDAGTFNAMGPSGLTPVSSATMAWGDYDNDGDLDLLMVGYDGTGDLSRIYRNDGGTFTDTNAGLPAIRLASTAWGDYDNDGDLDLLFKGSGVSPCRIYRNDAGAFVDINAALVGLLGGDAAWGDYDNDGDLDLVLSGSDGSDNLTRLYRNDAGSFADAGAGITTYGTSLTWADYDNDGDLDLLTTGGLFGVTHFYRNNASIPNTPPAAPAIFLATLQADTTIEFTWTAATDAQTPGAGLSYRVWVGTSTGNFNICPAMADTATGWRRTVAPGNLQGTAWTLEDVNPGITYFACVSAIDPTFMGSPCSGMSFVVGTSSPFTPEPLLITAGPNPTEGAIHIARPQRPRESESQATPATKIHYTLTTLSGTAIPTITGHFQNELDLDLSTLPSGIYILQLHSPQLAQAAQLKIIRQ